MLLALIDKQPEVLVVPEPKDGILLMITLQGIMSLMINSSSQEQSKEESKMVNAISSSNGLIDPNHGNQTQTLMKTLSKITTGNTQEWLEVHNLSIEA